MSFIIKFLVFLTILSFTHSKNIRCYNEDGGSVDWWFLYKVPQSGGEGDGTNYYYADSDTTLSLSYQTLKAKSGPIAKTLEPVYEESSSSSSVGWVQYNDESPDSVKHGSNGHSKGFVALDEYGGFWLIHSVPRFPAYHKNEYQFPDDEVVYGQSFLCLSLDVSTFNKVTAALLLNEVYVYDQNIPSFVQGVVPDMIKIKDGVQPQSGHESEYFQINTMGYNDFTIFAKSKEWNKYLYEDFVAPSLQQCLLAETWIRVPSMDSYCTPPYYVENVKYVDFGQYKWEETKDHSKVVISSGGDWVCVGDINRMTSQAKRGGGTVCFQNSSLHDNLNKAFEKIESCSGSGFSCSN